MINTLFENKIDDFMECHLKRINALNVVHIVLKIGLVKNN